MLSSYIHAITHKVGGRRRLVVVMMVVVVMTVVNLSVITTTTTTHNNNNITTTTTKKPTTAGHHLTNPITTPHHHQNNSSLEWYDDTDDGTSVDSGYGVSDISGNFTIHSFAWPGGSGWRRVNGVGEGAGVWGVCLATHASVDRLHWVVTTTSSWNGQLSVAIFTPGIDYEVAILMVTYLRRCIEGVSERVSFHVVYPRYNPPYRLNTSTPHLHCQQHPRHANEEALRLRVQARQKAERRYPQNLLRNVARSACPELYCLSADVDMTPVKEMWPRLTSYLASRHGPTPCPRCALVVPVYEVDDGVSLPTHKKQLLHLIHHNKARRFHIKVYIKNQGNSHLELWEVEPLHNDTTTPTPSSASYSVLYNISSYEEFWEPVLVLPRTAPPFDERFMGYGFTRSSQVYQLRVLGYEFQMLDEAFLTHSGFQTTRSYTPTRHAQIEINKIRYQIFKRELHARLGLRPPPPIHFSDTPIARALPALISRRGSQLARIIGVKKG
ncbi:hypothetical protein Pcinc_030382 [Petrolisthes cinctipes]|uniref:Beta-1,4-glucuronyltransferase 1 n=1 Tax=Petrolisthes cinctipes TaxID=88211 RepID=A0AAE1EY86_PETCI|nr:hypothetical protein Pcinc_030382 [Petrolisthes cinctipes]